MKMEKRDQIAWSGKGGPGKGGTGERGDDRGKGGQPEQPQMEMTGGSGS